MDKSRQRFLFLCILTAVLLLALVALYYGTVIEPGLEETDNKLFDIEIEGETWTPDLREMYDDSQPIEYLKYKAPRTLTINNQTVGVEHLVVVIIPEDMESRASFAIHTHVETWEDDNILVGNKTNSYKVESDMAYIFTDKSVSNDLYDRYKLFNHPSITFGIGTMEIDLTSAPFQEDSTHRDLQYNDDGEVIGVTEVTVIEGIGVHKIGIRTTDENESFNPDDVSFYLTSPEVYENSE